MHFTVDARYRVLREGACVLGGERSKLLEGGVPEIASTAQLTTPYSTSVIRPLVLSYSKLLVLQLCGHWLSAAYEYDP